VALFRGWDHNRRLRRCLTEIAAAVRLPVEIRSFPQFSGRLMPLAIWPLESKYRMLLAFGNWLWYQKCPKWHSFTGACHRTIFD
jgi:hypothetical protein